MPSTSLPLDYISRPWICILKDVSGQGKLKIGFSVAFSPGRWVWYILGVGKEPLDREILFTLTVIPEQSHGEAGSDQRSPGIPKGLGLVGK